MTRIRIAVYREAKATKVSRTWSCLLLLGAMLNLSGCQRILGSGRSHTPTPLPVSVNSSCDVTHATITEHTGTAVTWAFPGNGYTITFNPKYDKTTKKDITPASNSITYPQQAAKWDNAGTPTDCADNGGGCYFKYNIYSGGSLCKDPGIQIVP